MRRLRLLTTLGCLLGWVGALLLLGTPAYAHTALDTASPAPGAKIAPGADVIALTFKNLKPGSMPKISVTGPDSAAVPVGTPTVAVGGTTACASVTPLRAGVNTVTYTVTAGDGHVQTNSFQFQVADGAQAVTTPDACRNLSLAAPGASSDSGAMILGLDRTTALVVLAAAVVVAVGGGVLVMRRSRRTRPTGRRRAVV
ncbi:copper resistance protein CopC [Streptomyces sp. NPDC101225]|uniref:copper resistance CopC family protein n=1 Tax=Streptomyces sp. NPDC101225 TaxID=3366135 RepID=UPI0037F684F2